jgi:anti-sigma-K factor RskA
MKPSAAKPASAGRPGPKLPWPKSRLREAHTLAGAYVMDAVSAPDRVRFERHLGDCTECADEIASLRDATARLGAAAAVTPPAGLKGRVMAAAAMTRQQPPASDPHPAARARIGSRLRSLARPGWPVRLAVAAAAVVAVATAVVFGVANGSMRQQLNQAQVSSQQIAAVLTARDARMMTGPVAGGGTATVVMSHSAHALVFTATGLHTLPASRGYELWLIGPAGDRPVGMLSLRSHGMAGPVIASGLRGGDHLVLVAGPAGGARQPSAPMMLDLDLRAV